MPSGHIEGALIFTATSVDDALDLREELLALDEHIEHLSVSIDGETLRVEVDGRVSDSTWLRETVEDIVQGYDEVLLSGVVHVFQDSDIVAEWEP